MTDRLTDDQIRRRIAALGVRYRYGGVESFTLSQRVAEALDLLAACKAHECEKATP